MPRVNDSAVIFELIIEHKETNYFVSVINIGNTQHLHCSQRSKGMSKVFGLK